MSRNTSPPRRGELGWSSAIATACVACLACGCSSTRVEPATTIARQAWPREQPVQHPTADAPAPTAFPDVWRLEDVFARIVSANSTLAQAQARLDEARAARSEAEANWWPELSIGVDATATDQPSRAFGILLDQQALNLGPGFDATPGTTENYRKDVRLDWALFAPGRMPSTAAASEGESAAGLAAQAVERRLLNAGIQAWLGLRAARALEAVALESVEVMAKRLDQTRTRHEEGAALRSDVLRLEVSLSAARQDAAQSAQRVRESQSSLNLLLGRSAQAALLPADEEIALGAELPDNLDALVERARAQRLELQAAAHQVRMLEYRAAAARQARLPSLQAFASYGYDGEDLSIDTQLDSYAAGLSLRLPWSAGDAARIDQAMARERQARMALREMSLVVTREVTDAWQAQALAQESFSLSASSVDAAEEAFRIVAEAQDAGAATVTDVLEAENARRQARTRRVAAQAAVQIARARLVAAVGGVR